MPVFVGPLAALGALALALLRLPVPMDASLEGPPIEAATNYAPAWSPDGTRISFDAKIDGRWSIIAFRSDRSGRRELYVMGSDGSGLRALTFGTLDVDGRFAWSPDGRRLVFHALPRGQRAELSVPALLYAADLDGSGATALTTEARREYNPSFAPDGSWLAVDAHERGLWDSDDLGWEIFVMRADGRERRPLTRNRVNDWGPAWSPDGSRIAYCSGRNDVYEIHVMQADGSRPRRITRLVAGWRGEERR